MVTKKKKPKFNVPNLGFFKSVKARWRRPRGTHNKKRMKFKWTGAMPTVGYRNPEAIRGLHPSGKKEVLVHNMAELEGVSGKDSVARLSSTIGAKKRKIMEEKAKSMNLRIVNATKAKESGTAQSAGKFVAKKEFMAAKNSAKNFSALESKDSNTTKKMDGKIDSKPDNKKAGAKV
ncbi:50S ribosomal protein L32e [Candidatus Micrarchaeota archaeon]|nr:50S ribosomal protein L32e [Candidatus Micrarchaeota archaeon]